MREAKTLTSHRCAMGPSSPIYMGEGFRGGPNPSPACGRGGARTRRVWEVRAFPGAVT